MTFDGDYYRFRSYDGTERIFVPEKLQRSLIHYYHRFYGHQGILKTITVIKRNFHWKLLAEDVADYIGNCRQCLKMKCHAKRARAAIKHIEIERINQFLFLDFFGPLLSSGRYKYVLVMLEGFSKMVKIVPVEKADSKSVIQALKKYCENFGSPENILSDNGSAFVSEEFCEAMNGMRINVTHTSMYNP